MHTDADGIPNKEDNDPIHEHATMVFNEGISILIIVFSFAKRS